MRILLSSDGWVGRWVGEGDRSCPLPILERHDSKPYSRGTTVSKQFPSGQEKYCPWPREISIDALFTKYTGP